MSDNPHSKKPVVGLLGGMGSGKSLIARLFEERGAFVVSGDALGHEALRQANVKDRLVERWGSAILDERGEIDRRRVAAIVFADADQRRALEAVVFPWIVARMEEQVAQARSQPQVKLVLVDAAIMLEAGWYKICDHLVFVHVPREVRLQRLAQQRGWSPKEVEAREAAQMPLTEKLSRAGFVLENTGTPEDAARQVDDLLRQWGIGPAS
jgi:dephospho-CoA kinase